MEHVIAIDGVSGVGKTTFLEYVSRKGYAVIRPADFYKKRKDGDTVEAWRCVWSATMYRITHTGADLVFLDRSPASFEVYQQASLDWLYTFLPYFKGRIKFHGVLFESTIDRIRENKGLKKRETPMDYFGLTTHQASLKFRKAKVWGNGWDSVCYPYGYRTNKLRLLEKIFKDCDVKEK